jgi:hypothetical protein
MANMKLDPRAEPQYGDRVPYVIVARGPNVKLRDKPMSPLAYMADRYDMLNNADEMFCHKITPFSLVPLSVHSG